MFVQTFILPLVDMTNIYQSPNGNRVDIYIIHQNGHPLGTQSSYYFLLFIHINVLSDLKSQIGSYVHT